MAQTNLDALIVGGGPAGLSAALVLGRSRRRVLLAHHGPTRNASASGAHNVFTRDGVSPSELRRLGTEDLQPYGVSVREEKVELVHVIDHGFEVRFAGGTSYHTRKLLLATGVRDILPNVPGFDDLWGRGIYHCPYCHGWEVRDRPLGLYARDGVALHLVKLIRGWSRDLILFTNGASELEDEHRLLVDRLGIQIREETITQLEGGNGEPVVVHLSNGERVPRSGLFISPSQVLNTDLHEQLGVELTEADRVRVDAVGRTSVPGVYAAGDIVPGGQQVAVAAATGTMAGIALNNDLLEEEFSEATVGR